MNFSKMMRLACLLFAVLTFLVLRTAVAQAASSHLSAVGNVVGSSTSAHSETNIRLNEAVAMHPGINQKLVAHSFKSAWTSVASPNTALPNEQLNGVAVISSKDVWAVGYSFINSTSLWQTLTEHWDGTNWSVVPSPNVGTSTNVFNGVAAISTKDVWAVGQYYETNTSSFQTLTEHWNGTSWSVVPSPTVGKSGDGFFWVAAISSTDVWAVGAWSKTSKGPAQTLIEHWNGTAWSVVTSPNVGKSDNGFYWVATISSTDVWAVGYFVMNSSSPQQTLTEHWDGSSWSVVASPNIGTSHNFFFGVAAISSDDVWAVGAYYNTSINVYQTLTEHWNGTSWSVVPSPDVGAFDNGLNAVAAISSNDVWATGDSSSPPSTQTLIEHWNGTAWSVVPSPNFGGGNTLNVLWAVAAVSTSDVWTVGDNVTSKTSFQAFTEHWNGKSWSIIPPG